MNIRFAGDGKNTNRKSAPGDCSLTCFEGGLGSTGHLQGVGAGGSLFVCLCVCTGMLCSSGIDGHSDVCLTPCSNLCTIEISEPAIRTQGGSQYWEDDTHVFTLSARASLPSLTSRWLWRRHAHSARLAKNNSNSSSSITNHRDRYVYTP
jgi:hypothetical protein